MIINLDDKELYIIQAGFVKYCNSKEEAQQMVNKLNKFLGYNNYSVDDRWI